MSDLSNPATFLQPTTAAQHQSTTSQDQAPVPDETGPGSLAKNTVFVSNVKTYLKLHDEISVKSKEVTLLRKQKQELKDYIIHTMRSNEVEQLVSGDGKLYIAKTKSAQPINRDYVFSMLSNDLGVQAAEKLVETLWNNREITTKDTLRRAKAKP